MKQGGTEPHRLSEETEQNDWKGLKTMLHAHTHTLTFWRHKGFWWELSFGTDNDRDLRTNDLRTKPAQVESRTM